MKNITDNTKAYICAVVAVLSWSTVASAFKIGLKIFTVNDLLFFASLTASIIIFSVIIYTEKLKLFRELNPKSILTLVLFGLINPYLYYVVLFGAYDLLPAQIAQPLNYTWPIFLTIFSAIILKKKVPRLKYIGMIISFLGVGVISMAGYTLGGVSVMGVILAFSSAVIWAIYWILNLKNSVDPLIRLFSSFCVATIICGVLYFVNLTEVPSISGILAGVYIGAFEMAIPFILWGMALKLSTKQYIVNQISYFSPFLSLLFISVVLGEAISGWTITGLTLIVIGVLFNQFIGKSKS